MRKNQHVSLRNVGRLSGSVVCLLLVGSLCTQIAGLSAASDVSNAPTPEQCHILHLTGIGGKLFPDLAYAKGLKAAGLASPVEIDDWTGADRGLNALTNRERHNTEAARVAQRIRQLDKEPTSTLLVLSGHSGGAGIAVWALEKLPSGVMVDKLVLLAPALSPNYDLSAALKHVRGKAYVLHSEHDGMVLGLGTRTFGTVDGKKVEAAGRNGFVTPEGSDAKQYEKLVQVPYDESWTRLNNMGDHIGCMSAAFTQAVVAPLIFADRLPAVRPTTRPALSN